MSWVQWCYTSAGELRFGSHRISSTAGVQQGDPLGPLLFSLVILQLLGDIGPLSGMQLNLWYLEDGALVGSRHVICHLLNLMLEKGPSFGHKLNLDKCEIFCPTGGQMFSEFPIVIRQICLIESGAELVGSPIIGSDHFFDEFINKRVNSVLQMQSCLRDLSNS